MVHNLAHVPLEVSVEEKWLRIFSGITALGIGENFGLVRIRAHVKTEFF
jgi:hypothetical protein